MFNNNPAWLGHCIDLMVNTISFYVQNTGMESLHLSLAFNGGGGSICSKDAVIVEPGSPWHLIHFRVDSTHMIVLNGQGNVNTTLESVNEIRLLSSDQSSFTGEQEFCIMYVDYIRAEFVDEIFLFDCNVIEHFTNTSYGTVTLEWAGGIGPFELLLIAGTDTVYL